MRGAGAAAAGRATEAEEEEEEPAAGAAAVERAPADDDEVGSVLSASPDFAYRFPAASPASKAFAAAPPSAAAALSLSPRPLENLKPIFFVSFRGDGGRELFLFNLELTRR